MTARTQRQTSPALVIVAAVLVALVAVMGIYIVMGLNKYPSGQPTKNPLTGTYSEYLVVLGHRDSTFLHWDLHANIWVDTAQLSSIAPTNLPSGSGYFMKNIAVTCTVSGGPQPIVITFTQSVGTGSQWGQVFTLQLPSGSFTVLCAGVDQDQWQSQAVGSVVLP